MVITRRIRLILRLFPHRSSESPSMEKYPSDPYSFPTRQQILDISKHSSPCFPVLESYFIMREMTSRVMNMLVAMQCMSPTSHRICVDRPPHFNVVQRGNLAVDIKFSTAPTDAVSLVCYGEFENTIHIDSERNVIYNFNPTGSREFFHVLSNINMLKDLVRNEKRLNEHRTNHSCTKGRSYNEQEVLWNIS